MHRVAGGLYDKEKLQSDQNCNRTQREFFNTKSNLDADQ